MSHVTPVCVQVEMYSSVLVFLFIFCVLLRVHQYARGFVHASVGNEARRGCVIHISPHDRGCGSVPD